MKKNFPLIFLVIAALAVKAQNFTKDHIVVARLGNGINPLTTGALPVSLVEINPSTKVVTNTVAIPSTTTGQRLLINGNPAAGSNEGGISLSADGKYIVIGGADVALFDSDTGPDNKSFARINGIGNVDLFTINGNFFGGFIRATTSIDGSALWFTTNQGTAYVAWGATGTSRFTTTGSRYIGVIGNQLYSASATNPATILNFGTPQTNNTTNNGMALPGTSTSTIQSAYGFALLDIDNTINNTIDGNDVLYIVDQTVASPGIVKMAYNTATSNWDYVGKYTSTVPFYGLTARKNNNGEVELFCVSNFGENNDLVAIVDANTRTTFNSASITQTTLASAGANYVFRSVAFSPFDPVLPLDLLSFQATVRTNTATFKWKTKNEVNIKDFTLERSTNGNNFEALKTIQPRNVTAEGNYQSQDIDLLPGTYYYRLKITDLDGTKKYSEIANITIKGLASINLFPNPAQDYINIGFIKATQKRTFGIYSTDGKLIKKIEIAPNTENQRVNISELKSGAYVLKTETGNQTFIKK
ncbi:MAG: T9SS type A sorting domain-containing protein [Pedobacter sp.]|uniref:T9SS type A sorting domain-containing protein n=1 Tax=Pedobacter sp. TaxID=1411316 RepID=UPI0028067170|nr:T9SS type A sorting domain-containing protein [Pedobacter sp.]MDQ8004435.1 T9SS type A sorting domain-containing protein [Pedobacter sp.]